MSRMVSIFLPHLPLERLKRSGKALPDDRPFALVGSEERRLLLTAVNAASAAQGLIPGMGLADARAICPHLLTAPAEPVYFDLPGQPRFTMPLPPTQLADKIHLLADGLLERRVVVPMFGPR